MSYCAYLFLGMIWNSDSLCIDSHFSNIVRKLAQSVHVEASQVDFAVVAFQKPSCDSAAGPHCTFIPGDLQMNHGNHIESDWFSRVLSIPKEVSVSISGARGESPFNLILQSMFKSASLRIRGSRFPGSKTMKANAGSFPRIGREKIEWVGDWYVDDTKFRPVLIPSAPESSMRFSHPVVIQDLVLSASAKMLLVGYRAGKEQWRRELGRATSLVGSQVFAKWKGNGSIYRGRIVHDDPFNDALSINWIDQDQSFRQIRRRDIVSVVLGRNENLYSVDEIRFLTDRDSSNTLTIEQLIVAFGNAASYTIQIVRSGGGLVFEDDVSPGAVLYSAKDLIDLGLSVIQEPGWSSKELVRSLGRRPNHHIEFANPRSSRNILLWLKGRADPTAINIFLWNINSETLLKFLNINDMFIAILDSGEVNNSMPESFGLMHTISRSGRSLMLSSGDSFQGRISCTSRKEIYVDLRIDEIRESSVIVNLAIKHVASVRVEALLGPLGSLHIPATDDWSYPLTLLPARVDSFSFIEIFSTVEYVGCGGVRWTPTALSVSTQRTAPMQPIETWTNQMSLIFNKFNAVLSDIDLVAPVKSNGIGPLFGGSSHGTVADVLGELDD